MFDGECFDTLNIIQLTSSGYDYYPVYSNNMKYYAYDNYNCGSVSEPPPANSCGVLIKNENSEIIELVKPADLPYWGKEEDTVFYCLSYYDLRNRENHVLFDYASINFSIHDRPQFDPNCNTIFFIGRYFDRSNPEETIRRGYSWSEFQTSIK